MEKGIIPPKKIAEKTLNQEYSESNLKRVPAVLKCTLSQHFNPLIISLSKPNLGKDFNKHLNVT